jgi:hypothetical protein
VQEPFSALHGAKGFGGQKGTENLFNQWDKKLCKVVSSNSF